MNKETGKIIFKKAYKSKYWHKYIKIHNKGRLLTNVNHGKEKILELPVGEYHLQATEGKMGSELIKVNLKENETIIININPFEELARFEKYLNYFFPIFFLLFFVSNRFNGVYQYIIYGLITVISVPGLYVNIKYRFYNKDKAMYLVPEGQAVEVSEEIELNVLLK